jgi:hypothetical protein
MMLGFMSQLGWADIPNVINYQGYLTDSSAQPIDGTVNMTFSLYDAETGGTQLWSDLYSVLVINGLVNKDLGPINLDLTPPLYLGIQVNADPEMSPRQALTSVHFAYRAKSAHSLDAADGDPTDAVYVDNDGNVGIGTASPGRALQVGSNDGIIQAGNVFSAQLSGNSSVRD